MQESNCMQNQECNKCKRIFDSDTKYNKHIKLNRCKAPYECESCNYVTDRKSSYDKHLNTKKCKDNKKLEEKNEKYKCQHCNKSFRDNYKLSRHLNRKNPCYNNSTTIINNNTNNMKNSNNNTMMNSNNKTIIINAHDPSAFLKDLNKVDKAIYNNVLQSFSINAPESIERMNNISAHIHYKEPKLVTKEKKPKYSDEDIEAYNNESYKYSNDQYLGDIVQKTFLNPNDLEFTPFFRIPNTKKLTVKFNNELRELDYDIIHQVIDNINHKMHLLEKETSFSLYQIKKVIDEAYDSIRSHFIKRIKNYKVV